MYFEIIQYGNTIFLLFIAPLLGVVFNRFLSRKQLFWITGIALFLLIPIFTPYHYVIPYVYAIIILIIVSAGYAIKMKPVNMKRGWIVSGILFIPLGLLALMDSVTDNQHVDKTWRIDNYRIEYIREQPFIGHALWKYELSRYAVVPLFVKTLDTTYELIDDPENCLIQFTNSKVQFDKCNIKID